MTDNLTFVICPEGTETSLELFQKVIDDIRRLIRDVDYAVTRERGKRRWVIEALHSSNPTITVRPLLENEELLRVFIEGINGVNEGTAEPPEYFTEPSLEDLKRMRRLFWGQDRARSVEFSHGGRTAKIERDIGDKVEKILRGGYAAFGSIEGTLEAINLHGNPTFTIWDTVSKTPVRCYFPKERSWMNVVENSLEKRVIIRGKVNYFKNGLLRSISNIEEVIDATPDPRLPKATFGFLGKDRPSDIEEFLKHIREEV